MEPGHFAVRSWIPNDTNPSALRDRLTIYDAGDIQGFYFQLSTGKTTWVLFQVEYRLSQDDGTIIEGCQILSEQQAPLHFFSKEEYPMQLQQQGKSQILLTLPKTQVLMTLSEDPVFSPQQPSLPLSQQQQPLPFPSQQQSPAGPASRGPPKSGSSRPADGQPLSQNKNTFSPKSKALPSSNPNGREQRLSQAPKKQEAYRQPLPQGYHTGRGSSESHPQTSPVQLPRSSQPRPTTGAKYAEPVSTSPCLISSE